MRHSAALSLEIAGLYCYACCAYCSAMTAEGSADWIASAALSSVALFSSAASMTCLSPAAMAATGARSSANLTFLLGGSASSVLGLSGSAAAAAVTALPKAGGVASSALRSNSEPLPRMDGPLAGTAGGWTPLITCRN